MVLIGDRLRAIREERDTCKGTLPATWGRDDSAASHDAVTE